MLKRTLTPQLEKPAPGKFMGGFPQSAAPGAPHKEAIRQKMTIGISSAADAKAVAATTIDTWQQVTVRLAPLIGIRGVEVLFKRSLHLTGSTYPWLPFTQDQDNYTTNLATLKACLTDRERDLAIQASCDLLLTFTELLASLIGRSLAERILSPIYVTPRSSRGKEGPAS